MAVSRPAGPDDLGFVQLPDRLRSAASGLLLFGLLMTVVGFLLRSIYAVGGLVVLVAVLELRLRASAVRRHCGRLIEAAQALDWGEGAHWTVGPEAWSHWADLEKARLSGVWRRFAVGAIVLCLVFALGATRTTGSARPLLFIGAFAIGVGLLVGWLAQRDVPGLIDRRRAAAAEVRLGSSAVRVGDETFVWFDRVPLSLSRLTPHLFVELGSVHVVDAEGFPVLELRFQHRLWGMRLPLTAKRVTAPIPRERFDEVLALAHAMVPRVTHR